MASFRLRRKGKESSHDDPTQPIELNIPQSNDPEPLPQGPQFGYSMSLATPTKVLGEIAVPQIVVGNPSPSIEPVGIGSRFQSTTFRPDTTIDGWSTDDITVRGVSQRGHLHRFNGAPRQDDFAVHQLSDGRVVVLVADGVSESPQSHLGASIAVKQGAEWLRTNIPDDVSELNWIGLFQNAAYALTVSAQSLLNLADPDPVRAERELATTLIVAIVSPRTAGELEVNLLGVGDSSAWLLRGGNFQQLLGGKASGGDGVASSAVVALPRVPNGLSPVTVEVTRGDVLLVGTDGIGDPLGNGNNAVGGLLMSILGQADPPSLIEYAHAVDFSRENFDDDRTLVAIWPRRTTHE
jgi:hypothetical protein